MTSTGDNDGRLSDREAIVTAAGSGMGRAIAVRFATEGAGVLCVDIDGGSAEQTADTIRAMGGTARALEADVSDHEAVKGIVATALDMFDELNVIVNAAAASRIAGDVTEITPDGWQRVLDVNLTSIFLLCHEVLDHLPRGASIINVASQLGSVVGRRNAAYVTSKAAVIHLTKAIAVDMAERGIRANSLSPGAVETPRLTDAYETMEAARRALGPRHPVGRLGLPEEITGAAVYLAESESTFTTGADLVVDGGYIAW